MSGRSAAGTRRGWKTFGRVMPPIVSEAGFVQLIRSSAAPLRGSRALLVGISGIDGSGKGWIARRVAAALENVGQRVALLGVDLWLNLPSVRFSAEHPGERFYAHGLRLERLFGEAVLPLKHSRRLDLTFDAAEEIATAYRPERWRYENVDILLLEGIFLFKHGFRPHYDLAVWLDCSFKTALARAIARGQEGLPADETVRAYKRIYFPAQRVHWERDHPRQSADLVLPNDHRLPAATLQQDPCEVTPGPALRPAPPQS